jgi:predicted DNA-binding protein
MDEKLKPLTIRLPLKELDILKRYCERESRTQTDVLREFIRSLEKEIDSQ